jgi:diphthamide biosynthesis protein 2
LVLILEPTFKCYSDANGFEEVFRTNVMAKCSYLVERIKDANNIGILVGTLGIKGYLKAIEQVKQLCNRGNKRTYIIAVGKPNPAKLANFPEVCMVHIMLCSYMATKGLIHLCIQMDVFVAICCPEAEFGNKKDYIQPIVGLFEIELAFNKNRTWTDVCSRDFRDLIAGIV